MVFVCERAFKIYAGLYPLLPLMKWEKKRNKEEVINTVGDPACKADLFSAMTVVCADEYSASSKEGNADGIDII
jgi:hypothetical protein